MPKSIQGIRQKRQNGSTSLARLTLAGMTGERAGVRFAVAEFRRSVESELMERGGGGIAVASRVHTACVAMRRHLAAEKLLSLSGHPGTPECKLSIDQWIAVADRALRWKETADRALMTLGLDTRVDSRSWYDKLFDEQLIPPASPPPAPAGTDGQSVVEPVESPAEEQGATGNGIVEESPATPANEGG